MWAVFKGDEPVTKAHSTKQAAIIEAFERGLVTRTINIIALDDAHSIREVSDHDHH